MGAALKRGEGILKAQIGEIQEKFNEPGYRHLEMQTQKIIDGYYADKKVSVTTGLTSTTTPVITPETPSTSGGMGGRG